MKRLFISLMLMFTINTLSQTTYVCDKAESCDFIDGVYYNCFQVSYPVRIEFNENFDVMTLKTRKISSILFFFDSVDKVNEDIMVLFGRSENGKACRLFRDFKRNSLELIMKKVGSEGYTSLEFMVKHIY